MRYVTTTALAMAAGVMMLAGGCPAMNGGLAPLTVRFTLSANLGEFTITPGEPSTARGTGQFNITGGVAASANISIDLDDITITPVEDETEKGTVNYGLDAQTVTITLWIDDFDNEENVCDEGEQVGPFTITLDQDLAPVSIEPNMFSLSEEVISLLNEGSFSICIEVESTVAINVDVDALDINVMVMTN